MLSFRIYERKSARIFRFSSECFEIRGTSSRRNGIRSGQTGNEHNQTDNIRDVIAFPKIQSGACPLPDAPNVVENKQLDELGICLKE